MPPARPNQQPIARGVITFNVREVPPEPVLYPTHERKVENDRHLAAVYQVDNDCDFAAPVEYRWREGASQARLKKLPAAQRGTAVPPRTQDKPETDSPFTFTIITVPAS